MKTYCVRYKDAEGDQDEIEVEVEDHEDAPDAMEAAREELTARHPSVDTDEWDVLDATRVVPEVEEAVLYRYDPDLPEECWAVDVDDETIHVHVVPGVEGALSVSLNAGYEAGSEEGAWERKVYAANEAAIGAAAKVAVAKEMAARREISLPAPGRP